MHAGSIWVLVLLMKSGYGNAAVTINFPDDTACKEAMVSAKEMSNYQDAYCFHQFTGKGMKP